MKYFRIKGIRRRTGKWFVENWNECNEKIEDLMWMTRFNNSFYKTWVIEYKEV